MEPILNAFYRQKAQFNKAETKYYILLLFVSFLAVCLYKDAYVYWPPRLERIIPVSASYSAGHSGKLLSNAE